MTYDKAYKELQKIIADLQQDDISIDMLKDKVVRAKELISLCRKKLRSIEEDVSQALEEE